jgi:hypothetical protein
MSEHRTPEEQTVVAMAPLDGMADLWFAESGFERANLPEPIVRMIKQAHLEGLYTGRCSNVDDTIEKCAVAARMADRTGYEWVLHSVWDRAAERAAEAVRKLKKS